MEDQSADGTHKTEFSALPRPDTASGDQRRVGVEIEFSGLTEREAAAVVRDLLGGEMHDQDTFSVQVNGTELGDIEVVLDTALRKYSRSALIEAGLDAARVVVPVEIVTPPLTPAGLARLDVLREALSEAGAKGTDDGALLGFGVHFNIETVRPDDPYTQDTICAFGLMEDWLRAEHPIDGVRRLLPFVQPWPRAFMDALAAPKDMPSFAEIRTLYAHHVKTRNHALDLLPLYKAADAETFDDLFPDAESTKGRPAFHYRLPDCRIDDCRWSLAQEWERWIMIEALADQPELLEGLRQLYAQRPSRLFPDRAAWGDQVALYLRDHDATLSASTTVI